MLRDLDHWKKTMMLLLLLKRTKDETPHIEERELVGSGASGHVEGRPSEA